MQKTTNDFYLNHVGAKRQYIEQDDIYLIYIKHSISTL